MIQVSVYLRTYVCTSINVLIACAFDSPCSAPSYADLEVFFDPTSYTVTEDMNVPLVLRVSTTDFSFPFTVTVDTTDITAVAEVDYVPGGYTVSFQPGQDEATLVVPTIDDDIVEMVEMYSAMIASTSVDRVLIGSSDMANITIQDNDGMYVRLYCTNESKSHQSILIPQFHVIPYLLSLSQSDDDSEISDMFI